MTTKTYSVPGMHCPSCPKAIAMTLEDVPGVASVDARLEDKSVAVTFDEALTGDAAIRAAIREAGYEAAPLIA